MWALGGPATSPLQAPRLGDTAASFTMAIRAGPLFRGDVGAHATSGLRGTVAFVTTPGRAEAGLRALGTALAQVGRGETAACPGKIMAREEPVLDNRGALGDGCRVGDDCRIGDGCLDGSAPRGGDFSLGVNLVMLARPLCEALGATSAAPDTSFVPETISSVFLFSGPSSVPKDAQETLKPTLLRAPPSARGGNNG